jgi:hypothetical protein
VLPPDVAREVAPRPRPLRPSGKAR